MIPCITGSKLESLKSLLGGASVVSVAAHVHPDGDALGSTAAMCSYLRDVLGKDAVGVLPETPPASISFIIPEPCSCGRNAIRLGPVLGRKSQMLKVHGTTLFPNAFFHVLDGIPEVAEYYMEVSGTALSDEITMFVACKDGLTPEQLGVAEKLYSRTRIHVPVKGVTPEEARKKVFGVSRKPVRFFDLRKAE